MMPRCNHKWCRKVSGKFLDVYLGSVGERVSSFPDTRVYLCDKHWQKFVKKYVDDETIEEYLRMWSKK